MTGLSFFSIALTLAIFYFIGKVFYNVFSGDKGKLRYCLDCGHEGPVKNKAKGSMGVEIILWICFIIPGLIYSIWRLNSKYQACTSCGSQKVIPANSPNAIKLKSQAVTAK